MTIDPNSINVILATDCGSTTTKAIMIEKVNGVYRQTCGSSIVCVGVMMCGAPLPSSITSGASGNEL